MDSDKSTWKGFFLGFSLFRTGVWESMFLWCRRQQVQHLNGSQLWQAPNCFLIPAVSSFAGKHDRGGSSGWVHFCWQQGPSVFLLFPMVHFSFHTLLFSAWKSYSYYLMTSSRWQCIHLQFRISVFPATAPLWRSNKEIMFVNQACSQYLPR